MTGIWILGRKACFLDSVNQLHETYFVLEGNKIITKFVLLMMFTKPYYILANLTKTLLQPTKPYRNLTKPYQNLTKTLPKPYQNLTKQNKT